MKTNIEIRHLSKNYGQKKALCDVSLDIGPGMFGLLGRNGAGKTTLMRILATLLTKSGGSVHIGGIPIEQAGKIRPLIGYLPQEFSLYPNMKVCDAMDYLGILSGLSRGTREARIPYVLQTVNLHDCQNLRIRALSGGMKRRLGIAQAILHDPQVLIVDEPTVGLDPEERVRLRTLLCAMAQDRIVLLSTHIVEDIEKTCDRLAVLDGGKLLFEGMRTDFIGDAAGMEDAYLHRLGGDRE